MCIACCYCLQPLAQSVLSLTKDVIFFKETSKVTNDTVFSLYLSSVYMPVLMPVRKLRGLYNVVLYLESMCAFHAL